ncbi:MAG: hypothetical protein ACR2GN_08655 [Bacteroidia bacterium]
MAGNAVSKKSNSIKVEIEIILFKEDDSWIAYCPSLELTSYGDTQSDARAAFDEEMKIFISETNRKGTLERYLLRNGWTLQQKPKPIYHQPDFTIKEKYKNPTIYKEKVAIPFA